MIGVALKGLAGRKVRALLTAFAIVIGVSMVSGTFILTDTMQKSFDGIFDKSYAKTDAVVEGKQVIENTNSGITIPQSVLDDIRKLPQVAAASGTVSPYETHSADIIGDDGKAVARESLGGSFDPEHPEFSPVQLKTGKWALGSEQVVIDAGTAKKEHFEIGDTIVISNGGKKRNYKLTGTVTFGGVDSLGFGSVAAWDVKTAQRLFNRPGSYDAISIGAKPGTTPAEVVKAVQPILPGNLEVLDANKQAESDSKDLDESMAIFKQFLLAFGGIALLVGAFVIFNTLSITVAQRTREFATLRTLGASRKQILRSVKTEGLVIGLLASVIGLVLGLGIAKGMIALFSALGVDLPDGGTVFAQRTVIVSLVLGTSITLLASILPARRATRVPPIAAVREGSTLPPSRFASRSGATGIVVLVASVAALAGVAFGTGLAGTGLLLMVVGMLGLFVGIALVAPRLVKPLTRVVGWPARRIGGIAGELAGANSVRNPSRTASTAAALMIGLTLVTLVAVLGAGLRGSVEDAVSDQLRAGYVVDGDGGTTFKAAEGEDIARVSGVTEVSHVRSEQALIEEEETAVSGVDPATIAHFYKFNWTEGSEQTLGRLGEDGAIVRKKYADDNDLAVGSSLSLKTPSGEERTFVVRGIVDPPKMKQLLDDVVISREAFDGAFPDPKNKYTFLDADPSAAADLEATTKSLGDANLHTGAEYPKDATKDMATMLAMLYVLLGFSVIVSLFGMVNTMVLSVFERTREIGMLRTIGMTRRQARRMIRHESVITALIGSALGLGLGLFLAALVTQAASDEGIGFSLPLGTLMAFTFVAILAGIGAAVMPARRASRLDVLNALQYE